MYRKKNRAQLSIDDFVLPFGGKLSAENRWVKIAKIMPWELVESLYAESFNDDRNDGRIPIPARIAFGALYIKEHENTTDERTLEHIAENPYMQYFLGLQEFNREPLFDESMMVHFRKRFSPDKIEKINEALYGRMNPPKPPDGGGNSGTLILDATAAPSDIRYPTDLSLLNECREDTESIIDSVWEANGLNGRKLRYSRKKARRGYLRVAKQRKPKATQLKKAVKAQLGYILKNMEVLESLQPEILSTIELPCDSG